VQDWLVTDAQLALSIVIALGVVAVLVVWIVFRKFTVDFARLKQDLEHLSEDVKGLTAAEQRRFLKELKQAPRKNSNDPPLAA
jgi:biopolymer transport protein ExbB/TolQ